MKIAVLKEGAAETRCAAIPEIVKKYIALGAEVAVERGAGKGASVGDGDFEAAGAVLGSRAEILNGAGIVLSVTGPDPATLEGIEKGALFVENVAGIEGEGAGGYATEMSPEYQKAQAELVSSHVAKQDIVITTALIPGRPAPKLISDAQLASMRPGSVIVDLAAEAGGNVEGTVAGERVTKHGVIVIGASN